MLTPAEIAYLATVAAMSAHHGSYQWLVEGPDGWCYLSHHKVGHIVYEFPPT